MTAKHIFLTLSVCLCISLAACSNYNFSLNDRLLYEPPTLFRDYQIADSALANCLEATIEQKNISRGEQLLALNCNQAGIQSLQGLAVFSRLQTLSLRENPIQNFEAIYQLTYLRTLDLGGLSSASCPAALSLRQLPLERLELPTHCSQVN